jgi:hypothetical protein
MPVVSQHAGHHKGTVRHFAVQALGTEVLDCSCRAVCCVVCSAAGSECFLTAANAPDIVNVYEGTATGYKTYTPAAWTTKYPAYRVCVCCNLKC